MKLLGISGSLRRASHNTALLRAAARRLPAGVELELWDGLKAIPPYDEDDDSVEAPAAVVALRRAIAGADAVLFSTPEYNSSVPGQLKNALFGAVWSQAELRKVLGAIGARVVDRDLPVGFAPTRFGEDGDLVDAPTDERLREHLDALISSAVARSETLAA